MRLSITTDAPFRQKGAALFMALIMLLVLTILGVFGMNISRLENLMAGNAQFQTTALNNAEYVLARGIEDIQGVVNDTTITSFPSGGSGKPYHNITETAVHPENLNWMDSSSTPIFNFKTVSLPDTNSDGADGSGKYVIVDAGPFREGESVAWQDITNGCDLGSYVQAFVVTAQSESARGAKRNVQSVVVTSLIGQHC